MIHPVICHCRAQCRHDGLHMTRKKNVNLMMFSLFNLSKHEVKVMDSHTHVCWMITFWICRRELKRFFLDADDDDLDAVLVELFCGDEEVFWKINRIMHFIIVQAASNALRWLYILKVIRWYVLKLTTLLLFVFSSERQPCHFLWPLKCCNLIYFFITLMSLKYLIDILLANKYC